MKKLLFALLLCTATAPAFAQPGPGPQPNPWVSNGGNISYSLGGILAPSSVSGGSKGIGSINANDLYRQGNQIAYSFNGRFGTILPQANDYSFSMLSGTVPVSQGGTGLTAGTSGGIPYFSSNSTMASSAALSANALVIGGGAGTAPSTTMTAAGILTWLGTPSSANLAAAVSDETGTGALVFGTAPVITLANGTGLPISTGVSGLGTGIATFLAAPSSANLAAALTDETGSGLAVFATSPSLTTPTLGVATATSINKVAITAPGTSATLTIANGKTFTASNTLTLTGTDSTSFAFPGTSGTVVTLDATQTLTAKTLTSPVISGGTIDNAIIGGTTRAAISGTTGNFNGALTTNITSGSSQCVQASSTGVLSGTGGACTLNNRYTNFTAMSAFADNNNGNYVNAGFGANWKITPNSTGTVRFRITGTVTETSASGQAEIRGIYYGTGTAPSGGATVTGTRCNGNSWTFIPAVANASAPFTAECEATGLTLATQIWVDLGVGAVGAGTATFTPSSVIIEER